VRRRKQALKRTGHRAILFPAANKGLDKYCRCIAPHNQPVEGTYLCLERDHLFVFLVYRGAVIEADQHAESVAVSPTSDENKVSDLEREALWRTGRDGDHAAFRQIAHNPAQTVSNPPAIISAVSRGPILDLPFRSVIRFVAKERIETPGCLRNFLDPDLSPGRPNLSRLKSVRRKRGLPTSRGRDKIAVFHKIAITLYAPQQNVLLWTLLRHGFVFRCP
jgi:hypothetical protein